MQGLTCGLVVDGGTRDIPGSFTCDSDMTSAITPDGALSTIVTPTGRVFGITGGTRPDQADAIP